VGLVGLLAVQGLEHLDQDVRLVEEHLGRDGAGLGLVGLVDEGGHSTEAVDLHHGVVGRVLGVGPLELGGDDRDLGALVPVGAYDVAVVEPVHVVGAHHEHQVRLGGPDLVAEPVELVGIALREPLLVHRAGALLGDEQPQAAVRPVEVPRPAVAHLLLQAGRLVGH
jgi:hypothetical protein